MTQAPAPIALFVYNRPDHTRRTVEALLENEGASESDVWVFADAAKNHRDEVAVVTVRTLVNGIRGFRSCRIIERPANFGLARSIISGVEQVLSERHRIIVIEDDIVTSPFFLRYMNEALELYERDERVASVHGYIYPVMRPLPETFFLRGADCWGWATWRSRWQLFNPDGRLLLSQLEERRLTREFDLEGAFGFTAMLKGFIKGVNNSWAIRWHASAFLADKLTLYPGRSLVVNIGNDSSGTHCGSTTTFDVVAEPTPVTVGGIEVRESVDGREAFREFGLVNHLGRTPRQRIARFLAGARRRL